MDWIFLSVFSAFLLAIANIIDKYVITKCIKKPLVPVTIMGVIGFLLGIIIYFIFGFSQMSLLHILLALVPGILFVIMSLSYFKAIKVGEISYVVPLLYLSPLFISILSAILIKEILSPTMYFGMVLVVAGAIILSSKKSIRISSGKSFFFILISAIAASFYAIITKYLLAFGDFWTIFSWARFGTIIILIPLICFYISDFKFIKRKQRFKVIGTISLSEFISLIGFLLVTLATQLGPVTLVNTVASIRPFFVLFFALAFSILYPKILKEELGKSTLTIKLIGTALMFIGVIIISA